MKTIKQKFEKTFKNNLKVLLDSGASAADIVQHIMETIIDDLHPHFEIVSDEMFDLRESVYKRIFRQTETGQQYEISWKVGSTGDSPKTIFNPVNPIYN
jgi:hypothetical protein